jgi:uncharacterized protein YcfJ
MRSTQTFVGIAIAMAFAAVAFMGVAGATPLFANVASAGYGEEKVEICHKGKTTLSVAAPAVEAHLAHGDTIGACEG